MKLSSLSAMLAIIFSANVAAADEGQTAAEMIKSIHETWAGIDTDHTKIREALTYMLKNNGTLNKERKEYVKRSAEILRNFRKEYRTALKNTKGRGYYSRMKQVVQNGGRVPVAALALLPESDSVDLRWSDYQDIVDGLQSNSNLDKVIADLENFGKALEDARDKDKHKDQETYERLNDILLERARGAKGAKMFVDIHGTVGHDVDVVWLTRLEQHMKKMWNDSEEPCKESTLKAKIAKVLPGDESKRTRGSMETEKSEAEAALDVLNNKADEEKAEDHDEQVGALTAKVKSLEAKIALLDEIDTCQEMTLADVDSQQKDLLEFVVESDNNASKYRLDDKRVRDAFSGIAR